MAALWNRAAIGILDQALLPKPTGWNLRLRFSMLADTARVTNVRIIIIGQTIIFLPCGFYLLSSSFFFPRLISAVGDWMSTILPHVVWP